MTKITAVIVARGGSKRLLRKNLLMIGGKTLVGHKIAQLQQAPSISNIVVGSEDDEILADAERNGAQAVRRPEFFCDESRATANQMIQNMCELISTDIVAWTHCTNPLVSGKTYEDAVQTFLDQSTKGHDSLLSVAPLKEHLWDDHYRPLNYDPYAPSHVTASQLPTYYKQDGAIFIQPYTQMAANHYFFGKTPYLYMMPEEEVLDVNTAHDYELAKAFVEAK